MSAMMETAAPPLLITIEGLYGAIDLEVPGDVAMNAWLPMLLQHQAVCRPSDPTSLSQWTIGIKGGQRLDTANTLYNYEVFEGMILQFQPSDRYTEQLPEIEEDLALPNTNRLLMIRNALPFWKKKNK